MRKATAAIVWAILAAACGGGTAPPSPFISGLVPRHLAAEGGTELLVEGNDFVPGATEVTINGHPATNVVVLNKRRVSCNAPAWVPGDPLIATIRVVADGLVATADHALGYILRLENPVPEQGGHFGGRLRSIGASNGPFSIPGRALAVADFDGSNGPDVAVGVPGRDHGGWNSAGEVLVYYSNGDGSFAPPVQIRTTAMPNMQFGFALDAGDVSGDDIPDLLVGAPGSNRIYTVVSDGPLHTFQAPVQVDDQTGSAIEFGFAVALGNFDGAAHRAHEIAAGGPDSTAVATIATQPIEAGRVRTYKDGAFTDIMTGAFLGQNLGAALCCADLTNDGNDDLIIGSPGGSASFFTRAGSIWLIPSDGHATPGVTGYFPAQGGIAYGEALPVQNANLSAAIAAGKFDDVAGADLLVGVPRNPVGLPTFRGGTVEVFYGDGFGAIARRITLTEPEPEHECDFGLALTAGDFDGDGRDDAAIAAPRATVGPKTDAGRVSIFLSNRATDRMDFATLLVEPAPEAGGFFGIALASGDFNRDGRDDLVVAGSGSDGGFDTSGEVFIVFQPRVTPLP